MNILIITPSFPAFDRFHNSEEDNKSKFLFYYAYQWAKQGNNVSILHCNTVFPAIFRRMIKYAKRIIIINKIVDRKRLFNEVILGNSNYCICGINVFRIQVMKYFPHMKISKRTANNIINNIDKYIDIKEDKPRIIFSDYLVPSLDISSHIGNKYKIIYCQIIHQTDLRYYRRYKSHMDRKLKNVRKVLFRSKSLRENMEKYGYKNNNSGYIYSGIPENTNFGAPRKSRIKKIIFVGHLRPIKNINYLIHAMSSLPNDCDLTLDIVGSGPSESELKNLVKKMRIENKVIFMGKMSRNQVFDKMQKSDALVMVNKETYGIVYVEAMSQGCIVVAGAGQGIDGIVINGNNGYLVEINNVRILTEILNKLYMLEPQEVEAISSNAILTARKLMDDILAKELLNSVCN